MQPKAPIVKQKALVYITWDGSLLVFRQPHAPGAGIQVPGGTIKDNETPEQGALREAVEETGLNGLVLVRFLGSQLHDHKPFGRNELHQRYFFRVRCTSMPPEAWRHYESDPSESPGEMPLFEFFWARLSGNLPDLIADHGYLLPQLVQDESQAA